MQTARYYREQAYRALMLARDDAHGEVRVMLAQLALDCADLAEQQESAPAETGTGE